jgi:hypothetical protein
MDIVGCYKNFKNSQGDIGGVQINHELIMVVVRMIQNAKQLRAGFFRRDSSF